MRAFSAICTGSMSPLPLAVAAAMFAVSGQPPGTVPTSLVSPVSRAAQAAVAFGPNVASARPDWIARVAAALSS